MSGRWSQLQLVIPEPTISASFPDGDVARPSRLVTAPRHRKPPDALEAMIRFDGMGVKVLDRF